MWWWLRGWGRMNKPGCHADRSQELSTLPFSLSWLGPATDKMCKCFHVLEFPFLLSTASNPLWHCQQLIGEDAQIRVSTAQMVGSKQRKYLPYNCQEWLLTTASEMLPGGGTGASHPCTLPERLELHLVFKYLTLTSCLIFSEAKRIKDELLKRLMFSKPKSHSHAALYQKLISQALIF